MLTINTKVIVFGDNFRIQGVIVNNKNRQYVIETLSGTRINLKLTNPYKYDEYENIGGVHEDIPKS